MGTKPVIILCGGNINYSNLPIASSVSNAMIPVNGKPVIGWIIDDLIENGFDHVIVVVQEKHAQLINFVKWAFSKKTDLSFSFVDPGLTINHSLRAGLAAVRSSGEVAVNLGDTLIKSIPGEKDFVLVGDYDDPTIWCLTETNEQKEVIAYYDKEKVEKPGLKAIVGFYHFSDSDFLKESCDKVISTGAKELSSTLEEYGIKHPIKAHETEQWYDFGHISHFLDAKKDFLQSRFFNRLIINNIEGTIEKISTLTGKLEDELAWYENLPSNLRIFSPRVLEKGKVSDTEYRIVQEYYGYPNMAELFLYGNFDIEIWKTAISNLLKTHGFFTRSKGEVSTEDAAFMYRDKTWERLDQLAKENEYFRNLISEPFIILNGEKLVNLPGLIEKINAKVTEICTSVDGCVIHGDYCLSNILYDINNQIIRVIDPRGSFRTKGIYGDPRYDIAKLRHSIAGSYDYLIAELFSFEEEGINFTREIFRNKLDNEIAAHLDKEIESAGYDLDQIRFIEALLFLSMVPLHKDGPERQKMMYLRAIELFNKILN